MVDEPGQGQGQQNDDQGLPAKGQPSLRRFQAAVGGRTAGHDLRETDFHLA